MAGRGLSEREPRMLKAKAPEKSAQLPRSTKKVRLRPSSYLESEAENPAAHCERPAGIGQGSERGAMCSVAGRLIVAGGFQVGLQDLSPLSAPPRSGKCHNEVVLAPMFERLSTESVQDQLPYSVTHISMPATTEGRRGFSVSVESACSNYATTVQVRE